MAGCASAASAPRLSESNPKTMDSTSEREIRLMTSSLSMRESVRVRPKLPVALDTQPDARQPERLVHQEEDDGQAEDDVAGRGDEPERLRVDAGQGRRRELEQLGKQGHEHRAEDGPEDAAHAADDHHRE